jgi:hypothetical protein
MSQNSKHSNKKKEVVVIAEKERHKKRKSAKAQVRGHGDYTIAGVKLPSVQAVGSKVGELFGDTGSKVGGAIGSGVDWLVKQITGKGDYTMKQAALQSNHGVKDVRDIKLSGLMPLFSKGQSGSNHMVFAEVMFPVMSSQAFALQSYQINPGLVSTFPYLAGIAQNYQEYELMGMIVQYQTEESQSAINGTVGQVGLGTNYDPASTHAPQNMTGLLTLDYSKSSIGSDNIMHMIECGNTQTQIAIKQVRKDYNINGDLRFFDHGTLYVATSGFAQDGVEIGRICVTYSINLLKPTGLMSSSGKSAHLRLTGTSNAGIQTVIPLSQSLPVKLALSSVGTTIASFMMPKISGTYMMIVHSASNTAFATGNQVTSTSTDVTPRTNAFADGIASSGPCSGGQGAQLFNFNYSASNPYPVNDINFALANPPSSSAASVSWDFFFIPLEGPLERPVTARETELSQRLSRLESLVCEAKSSGEKKDEDQVYITQITPGSYGSQQVYQTPYVQNTAENLFGPPPPLPSSVASQTAVLSERVDVVHVEQSSLPPSRDEYINVAPAQKAATYGPASSLQSFIRQP